MRKSLLMAIVVVALVGCATRGTKFAMADVESFQPGITTMEEARGKLGKPTSESAMSNGATLLQWMYTEASPIHGSGSHVSILFNKDGKMVKVTHKTVL